MSSLIKAESPVVNTQSGRNYLKEIGKTVFTWRIDNFEALVGIGKPIISPSFTVVATDPVSGRSRNESFSLEMSGSKQFTVMLVRDGSGILLVNAKPKNFRQIYPNVTMERPTTFDLSHSINKRRIFDIDFATKNLPDNLTFDVEVSLHKEMRE